MKFFERGVLDFVLIGCDRLAIELHLLLQARGIALEFRDILGIDALPLLQAKHAQHP
ncbi:hypothetical protein D3C85_1843140 [compost metagenome]